MNTEVDQVARYMQLEGDSSLTELADARAALDRAISQECRPAAGARVPSPSRRRPRSHRVLHWAVGASVAAVVAGAVVFVAVPSARVPSAPAAAAEIARLAETVPPVPPLGAGQWYQYQLNGAITASVSSGTKAAPISSTATIPIAIGEWSNATSAVCTSQEFGTVTFADPADAQAWQSMGLVTSPANQPATACAAGVQASLNGGGTPVGPIDVSNITHDPATLASELETGTTGIPTIDGYGHLDQGHDQTLGFRRLAAILVGPSEGQWSGFGQEMLRTLARLPGIISLGTLTTHSGDPGLAFSMPTQVSLNPRTGAEISSFTPPTVILDPQDGTLLEVRNLDYPVLQAAAEDFVGSGSALVYSDGVSYGTSAAWIDPVSGLQVIDANSLPSWISTIHIIETVTAPSTTPSEFTHLVSPLLGHGNSDAGDFNVPTQGQNTDDITIMGSLATAQSVANELSASGLFTSVTIDL